MANLDSPFGLRPAFHLMGGVMRNQRYYIEDSKANAFYTGDLVSQLNTSKFIGTDVSGVYTSPAEASGPFLGVSFRDTDGNMIFRKSWVASTATFGAEGATALVMDDPFVVYQIQFDSAMALSTIGDVCDYTYVAGSHLTGQSKSTGVAGTSGSLLYIYDVVRSADNEVNAANNKLLVLINKHQLRNAGAASYAAPST